MKKSAFWEISCFYPLASLNNAEKQQAKLDSSYVMGLKYYIEGNI